MWSPRLSGIWSPTFFKYRIRYLMSIAHRGIVSKKSGLGYFKRAIDNGTYFGCPGKEIYYGLPRLSDDDMSKLACVISNSFPLSWPGRAVHLSVFLRYVYGCFDKKGCLHNPAQSQKMKAEKRDWSKSDKFVDCMIACFKLKHNLYGEMMCYEMKAHRLGDMIIIHDDLSYLPKMLDMYNRAGTIAMQIDAKKNACSAYFWAFQYLIELRRPKEDWLPYALLFCDNVEKYSRSSTISSKVHSLLIRAHRNLSSDDWNSIVQPKLDGYKNKVLSFKA